ncbi:hypothetical protein LJC20_05105 [Eubacteriales bacterium OttesenSCG-928-M02]|nr:hypothetical protein [Eubacteriales bacterium OttesenSCG-928-M02]
MEQYISFCEISPYGKEPFQMAATEFLQYAQLLEIWEAKVPIKEVCREWETKVPSGMPILTDVTLTDYPYTDYELTYPYTSGNVLLTDLHAHQILAEYVATHIEQHNEAQTLFFRKFESYFQNQEFPYAISDTDIAMDFASVICSALENAECGRYPIRLGENELLVEWEDMEV